MHISAAVVETAGASFEIKDLELAPPRGSEIVVRIHAAGLCHTDISAATGVTPFPLPAVLGHEGAGTVEAVGDQVSTLVPGDKVVLSFNSCGACRACRNHQPVYCEHWVPLNLLGGSRLDGSATLSRAEGGSVHGHFFGQSSFGSHALVSEWSAVKVPADVDLATVAPLGCSIQTGTGAVFNVARPRPGSTLVVFGVGAVGLATVMAAKLSPAAKVIAVDVHDDRLDLARELGATHTINGAREDAASVITRLTGGENADVAIETSGRVEVLASAVKSLASAGMCVVIGAPRLGTTLPVDVTDLLGRGIKLVGTNQGDSDPGQSVNALLRLHEQGKLPFDRLITKYPFADINRAVDDVKSGKAIKAVLTLT